jgi:hypothetical protein
VQQQKGLEICHLNDKRGPPGWSAGLDERREASFQSLLVPSGQLVSRRVEPAVAVRRCDLKIGRDLRLGRFLPARRRCQPEGECR